jgi:hypothetical protein
MSNMFKELWPLGLGLLILYTAYTTITETNAQNEYVQRCLAAAEIYGGDAIAPECREGIN